jgi:signal transduction histidine kinase
MDVSILENTLNQSGIATQVHTQIRAMHGLIDATVASVRRIAADLRPVMLDDLGPVPAIEWLVNEFAKRYGISVTMRIYQDEFNFNAAGGTALFRIVQEALTNVARHAEASMVSVQLDRETEWCVVRIRDNGRGIEPEGVRKERSFGLLGIRERARLFGGMVALDTAPGCGFNLTVSLPLTAVEQTQDVS